jgi:three-Cys-motif partner protein
VSIVTDISEKVWDLEPHTEAKHEILKRYLEAWFPIMSTWNGRILYIDGFAGPGEYSKGELGSPIIAINTAKDHKFKLDTEIIFWFIEARKDRHEHLERLLEKILLPDNMKYEVSHGKFDESLTNLFDDLDEQGKRIAPTFAFIDQFGYSIPFRIIERIMTNKKCEVLITFMSGFINRFISDSNKREVLDSLFGTSDWPKTLFNSTSTENKEKIIVNFYRERLNHCSTYVRSFGMTNRFNQPIYQLIFCTNNLKGLKEMKKAMWTVDETGRFIFSDRTDPNQTTLFGPEPNYQQLRKLITDKFRGTTISIENLENFVVTKTAFRETHFKRQILNEMEFAVPPEIKILSSSRTRRGTYPQGTIIEFL